MLSVECEQQTKGLPSCRKHRRGYFHTSQIQFNRHQPSAFEMLCHACSGNHRSTHRQFHLALAMFRRAGISEERLILASYPALLRRSHFAFEIHRRDASVMASQTREGLDPSHGPDQLAIWPNRHQHPCSHRISWRSGHSYLLENATQGHQTWQFEKVSSDQNDGGNPNHARSF